MVIARLVAALAALWLMTVPALADPQTITGNVIYRERMALPAGATLHVGLVTLPGNTPVVGAGAVLETRSTPPLGFVLNVRGSLDQSLQYGLIAEITSGRVPLFRNVTAVPVDLETSEPAAILVQRVGAPAPSVPPAPKGEPLADPTILDTQWQVTSIGGRPVIEGKAPTLQIAPDLRAGGTGGCNSYFAQASVEDGKLTFGPAAATRMACDEATMAQETAFFDALAAVTSFETGDHVLRLLDPAGVPLIGFVDSGNN